MTLDMLDGSDCPRRGDLLESNYGTKKHRTWFVLRMHPLKPKDGIAIRCRVVMVRWWEIEPELRMKLFRSAERRGGQRVIQFTRYPPKKKKTFEQYLGAK